MKRILKSQFAWMLAALAAVLAAGCSESNPPSFELDMVRIANNQIVPHHQQAIADTLAGLFGTPDQPYAMPGTGLDQRKLDLAAGPSWSNQEGRRYGLYRRHCAHCHGVSGDGDGPTAMLLDPYPRDYRPGVYKFKSTYNPAQPTDEDLHTVLLNGVPGTAMPSFALLAPDEVDALVEYVKYLSIRGQTETMLVQYIADEMDFDPLTGEGDPFNPVEDAELGEVIDELVAEVVAGWEEAEELVIIPEAGALPGDDRTSYEIAESAAKGRVLFYGTRANCFTCHGMTALGDGQQADYDIWSKAVFQFEEDTRLLSKSMQRQKQSLSELSGADLEAAQQELSFMLQEFAERQEVAKTLLDPRNAIPRNLRLGTYRGGRRPVDIYWRIHAGIAGTPMPGSGPATPGAQSTLTEEEIWQVVDYVRSLPFEPMSRPRPLSFSYSVQDDLNLDEDLAHEPELGAELEGLQTDSSGDQL